MILDTYGCVHDVQKFEVNTLSNSGVITFCDFLSNNSLISYLIIATVTLHTP